MSVFIIAEAGINHCGSLDRALKMVEAAAEAGADAVKFQSFTADELGYDEALTKFLRDCQLSKDDHHKLKMRADALGIEFMSTPFDCAWADFLVELGVKRLKISSGKVKDAAFVKYVGSLGLPVIMSNGMVRFPDFQVVVKTLPPELDLTLLYCVSEYPTPLCKVDIAEMVWMRDRYGGRKIGFSDHTTGIEASIIAAASGAQVIEKHFTLDRTLPGPDQCCSLEPNELKEMIAQIRMVGRG